MNNFGRFLPYGKKLPFRLPQGKHFIRRSRASFAKQTSLRRSRNFTENAKRFPLRHPADAAHCSVTRYHQGGGNSATFSVIPKLRRATSSRSERISQKFRRIFAPYVRNKLDPFGLSPCAWDVLNVRTNNLPRPLGEVAKRREGSE